MDLVKDNRTLSMESGIATLESVEQFTSKAGNETIKVNFREKGTEDNEFKGVDDVLRTSNINEFQSSFKRFYYLFLSSNTSGSLIDNLPDKLFYEVIEDESIEIDGEKLLDAAKLQKCSIKQLLRETCENSCEQLSKKLKQEVSYSSTYSIKDNEHTVTFYTIDTKSKKAYLSTILKGLQKLVGEDFYVDTKIESKPGKEWLEDCKVIRYKTA